MGRSIEEITVSGRTIQEVRNEINSWMEAQKLKPLDSREDHIKAKWGSGFATAAKYFEVFLKPSGNGVTVRVEGWISIYGVGESGFSKDALAGGIPRREGWRVIEYLTNSINKVWRTSTLSQVRKFRKRKIKTVSEANEDAQAEVAKDEYEAKKKSIKAGDDLITQHFEEDSNKDDEIKH